MKKVVITGMGVVTPIGIGKEDYWKSLSTGQNGFARITHFDPTGFACTIDAEVKNFDPLPFIDNQIVIFHP